MKNNHCLLALILLFFTSNFTFSQTDRAAEAFENAPYIFEAIVTDLKPVQDETGKYFISYKMHITQKLKGDKKLKEGDTIEVILVLPDGWHIISGELGKGGLYDMPLSSQRGLQTGVNTRGVFFMQLKSFTDRTIFSPYKVNSDAYFSTFTITRLNEQERKIYTSIEVHGFGKTFDSVEEFNEYLISMKMPALGEKTVKKKMQLFQKKAKNSVNKNTRNGLKMRKTIKKK